MEEGQNENRINQIFEDYFERIFEFELNNHKIECNYQNEFAEKNNEENTELSDDDSFLLSDEILNIITNDKMNVKKIKEFPYSSIGILFVKFPKTGEDDGCFVQNPRRLFSRMPNLYIHGYSNIAKPAAACYTETIKNRPFQAEINRRREHGTHCR